MKILSLTDKGKQALGIEGGQSDRHGGPEHRYWVSTMGNHLRKHGYQVAQEASIGGGKAIDIMATQNGKRIAFEIETGKSDVVANIEKVRAAGIPSMYIIATSAPAKEAIERKLTGDCRVEVLSVDKAMRRKIW